MIVSKNGEDDRALRYLKDTIDCSPLNRRILALMSLEKAASIQTNLQRLDVTAELQSVMNGMVDEILAAVEIILANRDR